MIAHASRHKFESKAYRDTYMAGRVRTAIALQIRALREQRCLSQTDFAHRLGKPQSVLSRLENTDYGRVTIQTLLDIASALDVALIVKFCTYRDFLIHMSDTSDHALSVDSFSIDQLETMPAAPLGPPAQASPQASQISDALLHRVTGGSGQPYPRSASDFYVQDIPSVRRSTLLSGMRAAA